MWRMYLRESKQKRANGKVVTYLQIAENAWNPEKGRSQARIIYNCGRGGADVMRRATTRRRISDRNVIGNG